MHLPGGPVDSITIQNLAIIHDRAATEAVYDQIESGSPEQCGCADCRNFAMQRLAIHPPEAMDIFKTLGIDFRKESEIWNAGNIYGGWFHFVGNIVSGAESFVQISPAYKLEFSSRRDLLPKEFGNAIVSQLEFFVEGIARLIAAKD